MKAIRCYTKINSCILEEKKGEITFELFNCSICDKGVESKKKNYEGRRNSSPANEFNLNKSHNLYSNYYFFLSFFNLHLFNLYHQCVYLSIIIVIKF